MKTSMLRIVSFGLLLATPGSWCVAAPAPADLSELATLKLPRGFQATSVTFSPDGKALFSMVRGQVWLWDVASRNHVATLEHVGEKGGRVSGMALSPDGNTIATYGGRTIVLWDVAGRKVIATLKQDGDVCAIVYSPDGKSLSAMIENRDPPRRISKPMFNSLQIWDVEKKNKVRAFEVRPLLRPVAAYNSIERPVMLEERTSVPIPALGIPTEPPKTIPFSLVDAFTGERVVTCARSKEESRFPPFCSLNRDETMLASAGPMSPVQLWDRKSGKRIAAFKFSTTVGTHLTFSPDGKILAAGYFRLGGGFLLFEVPSGKILADQKQDSGFSCVAFSPDGRLLATGHDRDTIKLWSIPERWRKDK